MFTGIIEEMGTIEKINQKNEAIVMTIEAKKVLEDVNLGDSIAVNGVCLTVTSFDSRYFTVDLMPETVNNTSLRLLSRGKKVNLERAMAANGRFGGHFVSGHVDGIATIVSRTPKDNAVYFELKVSSELRRYMVQKGSVTIDGTSLTIFGLTDSTLTVSLIPHTLKETVFGEKGPGDIVNIECDVVGKYIEQFISERFGSKDGKKQALSAQFLTEHGFM